MKPMRLDKLLAHQGYGTRKEVKRLIRQGLVSVNGDLVFNDDQLVQLEYDEIHLLDQKVDTHTLQYLLHFKTKGVVCAHTHTLYPTVYDQLGVPLLPHAHTVGRLDVDTTGIILITNDGSLTHRLLSPRYHVEKIYEVQVAHAFDESYLDQIKHGLILSEEERCLPAEVELLNQTTLRLTLVEGKYHQVKRMMKACQNEVIELKRTHFAGLDLTDLQLGHTRSLSASEVKRLSP